MTKEKQETKAKDIFAKKDWRIITDELDVTIKKGDKINEKDFDSKYLQTLKTEGVI